MVLSFNYVLYKFTLQNEIRRAPLCQHLKCWIRHVCLKKVYPWIIVLERENISKSQSIITE